MSLGQIHYSEESMASVIRETLRQEKEVVSSRVIMHVENEPFIYNVYITLNTLENALSLCKNIQTMVHESITKMFGFEHITVHVHLESIIVFKNEKE